MLNNIYFHKLTNRKRFNFFKVKFNFVCCTIFSI